MSLVKHKTWELPLVDLSHDEGDPRWHEAGGNDTTPVYEEDGTIKYYRWNGLEPGHYQSYFQLCVVGSWAETVTLYEADPDDVHNAWWYIDTHPVFWTFSRVIHEGYPENHVSNLKHEGAMHEGWPAIDPHKVNCKTRRIEREKKNTRLEWWFEFGPSSLGEGGFKTHDYELDGSAATYEQCIIKIAKRIHKYYGNDRSLVDSDEYWRNRKLSGKLGGKKKSILAGIEKNDEQNEPA